MIAERVFSQAIIPRLEKTMSQDDILARYAARVGYTPQDLQHIPPGGPAPANSIAWPSPPPCTPSRPRCLPPVTATRATRRATASSWTWTASSSPNSAPSGCASI
ncbi:hypothetical protein DFAR_750019 [Desulfarculales bacterium]